MDMMVRVHRAVSPKLRLRVGAGPDAGCAHYGRSAGPGRPRRHHSGRKTNPRRARSNLEPKSAAVDRGRSLERTVTYPST